jgi:hypothetical protein
MADKFQWTALPRGVDDKTGALKVSVLVSPTIGPVELPQHKFFADWPAAAKTLRFDVVVNNKVYPSVAPRQDLPDSAVWRQLFGPIIAETPVKVPPGYLVDYSVRKVRDHITARHAFAAWKRAGLDAIHLNGPASLADDLDLRARSIARRDTLREKYRDFPPQRALLESLIERLSHLEGSDLSPEAWTAMENVLAASPSVDDVSFRLPLDAPPRDIQDSLNRRRALREICCTARK